MTGPVIVNSAGSKKRAAAFGVLLATLAAGQASAQLLNYQQIIKKADAVPGIAGEFWAASPFSNPSISDAGNVVFNGTLDITGAQGGTATTANRRGIWYGGPGTLNLVARDGSVAGMPTLPNVNNWVHNSTTGVNGLATGPTMTPNGTMFISSQLNGTGAT